MHRLLSTAKIFTPRFYARHTVALISLKEDRQSQSSSWALVGAGIISSLFLLGNKAALLDAETPAPPGHPASSLPLLSYEQFKAGKKDRVWVTLDGGVYDVTSFMDAHPGGIDRIQMVNNQDLAKFWGVYDLHDRPHIRALLEEYRIGNLTACDYRRIKSETNFTSYYESDPPRPAAKVGKLRVPRYNMTMFVRTSPFFSAHPWNSEPLDLSVLVDSFFTPNDLFFVRNHNNVPEVDPETFVLEIEGNDKASKSLSSTHSLPP
jgi:cytochrome b involved in lipid metabolism